jgi:endonuclease-3
MADAARIESTLDGLYPEVPIPLDHRDPFTLLVAVMLSAQTTDKMVNSVTPALFDRAPTPAALAALDEAEVLGFIKRVGLAPTKARNLVQIGKQLVDRHGGVVPSELEALEALPGVGHKTASVVVAQAFGIPAFPVDTHIHRLAWRWGLSDGSNVVATERDLKAAFPMASWNGLHLRIIMFGRDYCPARRHDWEACPVCAWAGVPARRAAESAHDTVEAAIKATLPAKAPRVSAAPRASGRR